MEKRIYGEIEEKEYIESTEPNLIFQIDRKERDKVIRLIEFKFAFIAFLAIIVSLIGVDLNRIIQASSSYILILSIFIVLASSYILFAVLLTFVANREIDDLVLNKSYLLITIEILVAIFLVLGLLVEGIFFVDLAIYMLSIIPTIIGFIYLFTPVRIKKSKNGRKDAKIYVK